MFELDAERISALTRGFYESRLLLTAVELDLFTILSGRWLTVKEIGLSRNWDLRALRIVLDALVVIGLLVKRSETYSTTGTSADFLSSDGSMTIRSQALHGAELWHKWSQLTGRVAGTGTEAKQDRLRAFIGTMHLLAPRLAPGLAALIRPELSRKFLDVGGGSGAYTMAFLTRDRSLSATLFDLPEVIPICAEYLREYEFESQVKLVAGDYTRDELPGEQGMVFLSAVIHSLSLEQLRDLFGRVFRALVPGGRIVIRDYVMSPDRLKPRDGAIFAVNMLVCTDGGGTHTFLEIRECLEAVGFFEVRMLQDGERMNAVVEAYRPPA